MALERESKAGDVSMASMRAPRDLVAFCTEQMPRLSGAMALFLGDPAIGAEIAQEALLRVCRDWEKVSVMDHPGPWLHRVAINLATSELRRRRAERRAMSRSVERPSLHEGDPSTGPAVRTALATLSPDERAVIVLRYYADLSVAETAGVLGVAEGTVKTRTRRAIARMRATGLTADIDPEDQDA